MKLQISSRSLRITYLPVDADMLRTYWSNWISHWTNWFMKSQIWPQNYMSMIGSWILRWGSMRGFIEGKRWRWERVRMWTWNVWGRCLFAWGNWHWRGSKSQRFEVICIVLGTSTRGNRIVLVRWGDKEWVWYHEFLPPSTLFCPCWVWGGYERQWDANLQGTTVSSEQGAVRTGKFCSVRHGWQIRENSICEIFTLTELNSNQSWARDEPGKTTYKGYASHHEQYVCALHYINHKYELGEGRLHLLVPGLV